MKRPHKPLFFIHFLSARRKRIKNIQSSSERTEREHTQVCFAKRETRSVVFEEMRAPLSLSLSRGGGTRRRRRRRPERTRTREREKIENCVQIYFVPFRARAKIFPNRFFFLPLLRFQNASRAMRSNNNNNDTNRREKERERERETSFSLSRDRKNALLSALWCWRLRRRAQKNHFN